MLISVQRYSSSQYPPRTPHSTIMQQTAEYKEWLVGYYKLGPVYTIQPVVKPVIKPV